jgi:hypothetical protein
MKDKEKVEKIINDYSPELAAEEILRLFSVSNSALIDYIETEAEIAMPIDELMNDDGSHITKKQYGKVLLKYLVKELREHYC